MPEHTSWTAQGKWTLRWGEIPMPFAHTQIWTDVNTGSFSLLAGKGWGTQRTQPGLTVQHRPSLLNGGCAQGLGVPLHENRTCSLHHAPEQNIQEHLQRRREARPCGDWTLPAPGPLHPNGGQTTTGTFTRGPRKTPLCAVRANRKMPRC